MARKLYLLEGVGDGNWAFEWENIMSADVEHGQHYPTIGIVNPSGATVTLSGHVDGDTGAADKIPLDNGVITGSKVLTLISQVPWLHIDITGATASDISVWLFG
jgi:hypothetical protein